MSTQSIRTLDDLRDAIRELEDQDYVNQQFIRRRVTKVIEDLRPVNLLKNIFRQVVNGSELKTNLFRMAAGAATSYLLKGIFKGKRA